jgi:hypothetical protein
MSFVPFCDLLADLSDEDDEDEYLRSGVIGTPNPFLHQLEYDVNSPLAALAVAGELAMRQERAERRRPVRGYLSQPDLLQPREQTPWQHMLAGRNDRAFITTMGFNVDTFDLLLESGFQTAWDSTAIARTDVDANGVPRITRRSLDAVGGLGLCLHYLHLCMTAMSLQQISGLIPSTVSHYLNFGLDLLDATLAAMPLARVTWPNEETMKEYEDMIVARHGLLKGAFGSIDGLNLMVEVPNDPGMENATFNSWMHGHYSSQVFMFGPDGAYHTCVIMTPVDC